MAVSLKAGDLALDPTNYSAFVDSMAETMEKELDRLLELDSLPALPKVTTDRELRDRRRLFVAIARGVVLHLVSHNQAFDVTLPDTTVLHPTIRGD